jgi:hypothetical protein
MHSRDRESAYGLRQAAEPPRLWALFTIWDGFPPPDLPGNAWLPFRLLQRRLRVRLFPLAITGSLGWSWLVQLRMVEKQYATITQLIRTGTRHYAKVHPSWPNTTNDEIRRAPDLSFISH